MINKKNIITLLVLGVVMSVFGSVGFAEDPGYEINPYDADVSTCRASDGKVSSTTGQDSASWFVWNGCAKNKYYEVNPNEKLTFHTHTDSCSSCMCTHPNFYIYEYENGNWIQKKYFDLPDGKGLDKDVYYIPSSNKIKIYASACFYLDVYSKTLVADHTQTCTDSDDGKNYYVKGSCTQCDESSVTGTCSHVSDYCIDSMMVKECYCDSNEMKSITYSCPNGCRDGACVKEDDCPEYYSCPDGTKVKWCERHDSSATGEISGGCTCKISPEDECPEQEKAKEQVKCVFDDSNAEQKCYSNKGECSGVESCVVDVEGYFGEQITWKSTCGGYIYTIMDGQNDYAKFQCEREYGEKCVEEGQHIYEGQDAQCCDGLELIRPKYPKRIQTSDIREKTKELKKVERVSIKEQIMKKLGQKTKITKDDSDMHINDHSTELTTTEQIEEMPHFAIEGKVTTAEPDIAIETGTSRLIKMNIKGICTAKCGNGICDKRTESNYNCPKDCREEEKLTKCEKKGGYITRFDAKCEEGYYETDFPESRSSICCLPKEIEQQCQNSCPYNNKCIPFGTRVEETETYCSIDEILETQKQIDAKCQNNYECISNACVSGKCLDVEAQLGFLKNLWCKISNLFDKEGYERCLMNS